ncbi:family 78 glycoside hydrolase catalytic domain [Microbacterium sp. STN6]|uniref:alpha-L-rhamnosidase n=1 Tax=Microbacterium sp. STN6 TaxID=2995588 RepID=UPI002260B9DC|nr:alpha-L-rhamnosidase [Microbacterium sp. STN6]MCX7520769.1 family 78 glycoside hydrolase catalytic domain [Microbacterium sp. STN6]
MESLADARWIEPFEPQDPGAGLRPAYLLRRSFVLTEAPTQARVDATAHGVYELFVNGQRVGDEELAPGFTAYRTRLQVQSWDIAGLLRPGHNVIGAILSDGWFRGRHGFVRHADGFGARTALLAAVHVTFPRGETGTIVTDADWQSTPGHITRADLMDGQTVDFRLYDASWCMAEPEGETQAGALIWHPVALGEGALYDDRRRLVPNEGPRPRRIETLAPAAIAAPRPGTVVVDFGQNINGWVRLERLGPAGTRLTLTHGEALDAAGLVTTDHLRAFDFATGAVLPAGQVDEVISAGRQSDVFEPRHTTHGFRYVQLDGVVEAPSADEIRAVVVHTDLRRVGTFACSDAQLNAFHDAAVWSFRGNACDIPTDCPQRERSGFTGDWQVFVAAAALVYDVRAFSEKWLRDLAADQWADGRVPTIVPNPGGDRPSGHAFEDMSAGSAGWGDAAVLVPWELWRSYGDIEILARQLPSMRRWVDYAAGCAASARHPERAARRPHPSDHEQYLWDSGFHFGEWLEPGVEPNPDPTVDHGIVATAFLHRSAHLVARAAALLGDAATAAHYDAIAEGARQAWRAEYVRAHARLTEESQANYVRGLAFGLFPERQAREAAARLAQLIAENGGRLATGFLSTGQLLQALADNGQERTAFEVLRSRGVPSWLGMLERGATTIWEWWDGVDGDTVRGSLNHYSKGAAMSFLYTHIAGIRMRAEPTPLEAGYRRVTIAPLVGGGLTWASASVETEHGLVSSAWRLEGDTLRLEVEIPPGCTAEIRLPDGSPRPLRPGQHTLTLPV